MRKAIAGAQRWAPALHPAPFGPGLPHCASENSISCWTGTETTLGDPHARRNSHFSKWCCENLRDHGADDSRDPALAVKHRRSGSTVVDHEAVIPLIDFKKRGACEPAVVRDIARTGPPRCAGVGSDRRTSRHDLLAQAATSGLRRFGRWKRPSAVQARPIFQRDRPPGAGCGQKSTDCRHRLRA